MILIFALIFTMSAFTNRRKRNVRKRTMKRFSILTAALIVSIALAACSSAPKSNDAASGRATESDQAAANGGLTENNKAVKQKNSEDKSPTKTVEIYDGRKTSEIKNPEISQAEREQVENAVKAKESAIREKITSDCAAAEFLVSGGNKGAFTKPNAAQTIYFYSLCTDASATSPLGIGGIVVFEAGVPTSLYAFQTIGFNEMDVLPDINRNGLAEIIMISEDGGQGARATEMTILEYEKGNSLGQIGSRRVGSVSFTSTPSIETTTVIYVEPSARPVFSYDLYFKEDGAKEWSPDKKSKKFALTSEDKNATDFIKIN